MKKKIVQDVIPPKKSIRNIELDYKTKNVSENKIEEVTPKEVVKPKSGTRSIRRIDDSFEKRLSENQEAPMVIEAVPPRQMTDSVRETATVSTPPTPPAPPKTPLYTYEYDGPKKRSKKLMYISLGVLVLVIAFGISAMFKSATIKITPKQETETLNATFSAKKDPIKNELGFQVVTITKDVEKTTVPTGEEKIEKKATGKVILYNNYSTTPQKLLVNTRLETPERLIFRLQTAVTIPGKTTKDGKSVAGSVEVSVIADSVGTNYNIGLKDFTIVGFKGDPKYNTVYGRSKTPMTGGFSGVQKTVGKDALEKIDKELEVSLKEELSKNITSQIPANFVLYKDSLSYNLETSAISDSSATGVVIKKRGEANAVIFDKGILTRNILSKIAPAITDNVIIISNLDSINFSYATGTPANPDLNKPINFTLKGDAKLVWSYDENKLKSELLGLSKKNAMTIISSYKSINEAWIETRPFWNQTIPKDPKKVTLTNTLNQP